MSIGPSGGVVAVAFAVKVNANERNPERGRGVVKACSAIGTGRVGANGDPLTLRAFPKETIEKLVGRPLEIPKSTLLVGILPLA